MARVLIIGDTHCPAMHPGYISFLKRTQKKYRTTRTVHIGDLVDWHAISFHQNDPGLPSPEAEYREAWKQVRKLHDAFPKVDYLIGNHSCLPARKAVSVGLPELVLKDFKSLWQLKGWTIHPRYHDLIVDGVVYRHGDKGVGGQMPALKNAQAEFSNLVQGHHHSKAGVWFHACHKSLVWGLQVGCGCQPGHPAMAYGRVYSARPIIGCGVVIDGKFPIFEPMPL